jgi:hypothetical protein
MNVRYGLFEESEHAQHTRSESEKYRSSVREVLGVAISKEKEEEKIHS